ncbi:MAG: YitT family protein, partial [Clostridia bacterium]|nr:YitT family protein [Clostridia bacterium]
TYIGGLMGKLKFTKPDKKTALKFLCDYAIITLGCVIYSLGVSLFLDANKLASGGVTGIAIIIHEIISGLSGGFDLDTGIIIVILNVPLFILGAIFVGKKFIISTVYSTVLSSALIWVWNVIFAQYLPFTDNLLISALVGGFLFGLGLGLIFRQGSSTGGTDIIVKMLRKKFRYIRTGVISLTIDVVIVCASAAVFRDFELACYTIISIVVFTTVFDWVLYGGSSAKLIYIITDEEHAQMICDRLLKEIDSGATLLDGKGAYTGDSKRIVMCAAKNFMYPKLRDIVKSVDPNAFTIVSSAKEIYGEGYKNHTDEDL